jgi:hypothetical protein
LHCGQCHRVFRGHDRRERLALHRQRRHGSEVRTHKFESTPGAPQTPWAGSMEPVLSFPSRRFDESKDRRSMRHDLFDRLGRIFSTMDKNRHPLAMTTLPGIHELSGVPLLELSGESLSVELPSHPIATVLQREHHDAGTWEHPFWSLVASDDVNSALKRPYCASYQRSPWLASPPYGQMADAQVVTPRTLWERQIPPSTWPPAWITPLQSNIADPFRPLFDLGIERGGARIQSYADVYDGDDAGKTRKWVKKAIVFEQRNIEFKGEYLKGNRELRMRRFYTDIPAYRYRYCSKVYKRNDARRTHEWKVHNAEDCIPSKEGTEKRAGKQRRTTKRNFVPLGGLVDIQE